MKKVKFKNREGTNYTFTLDDNGDILWEGDFKWCRFASSDDGKITMVDPSGGPYISVGFNMDYYSNEFNNMIVRGFEKIDNGYKLIIQKPMNNER